MFQSDQGQRELSMWDLRSSERTGPGKRFGSSTGQVLIVYVLPVGHRLMLYNT